MHDESALLVCKLAPVRGRNLTMLKQHHVVVIVKDLYKRVRVDVTFNGRYLSIEGETSCQGVIPQRSLKVTEWTTRSRLSGTSVDVPEGLESLVYAVNVMSDMTIQEQERARSVRLQALMQFRHDHVA